MYKVFINDITLKLTDKSNDYEHFQGDKIIFQGKKKLVLFLNDIQGLSPREICIYHYDMEELQYYFRRVFKYVKAAGGLVRNDKGEYLFIFRKGKWDIPKGKMEKGELPVESAIREVEEECGISGLTVLKELTNTYHTYSFRGKEVLKKTYWFIMETTYAGSLVPQIEEEITEVRWVKREDWGMIRENTFNGILEVLEAYERQSS